MGGSQLAPHSQLATLPLFKPTPTVKASQLQMTTTFCRRWDHYIWQLLNFLDRSSRLL